MDEGYTKFRAHWTQGNVPWTSDLDELDAARTRLHDLGLIGIYANGIGFGNVSLRIPQTDTFVISGTATGAKRTLARNGYCRVTDWCAPSNTVWCRGPIQASSESMSHGAVYRANSAVNAVIHVHSRRLFDFMLTETYPATPADIAFGTPAMAAAIENIVKDFPTPEGLFVMAGHDEGIMAYGTRIEKPLKLIIQVLDMLQIRGHRF